MTKYGEWLDFCRNAGNLHPTIPVCNLFLESRTRNGPGFASRGASVCNLRGIKIGQAKYLANLGGIILAGIAILVCVYLIYRASKRDAAVGRLEVQLLLLGYIIISICTIFGTGGIPMDGDVIMGFSAAQVGAVVATSWILFMNAVTSFQFMDDGTIKSFLLISGVAVALFVGAGYIALDIGFDITSYFAKASLASGKSYGIYTLYLIVPLAFICGYFALQAYIAGVRLGEFQPFRYLIGSAVFFALGQVLQLAINDKICDGTNGRVNGGLFEPICTLIALLFVYFFWESITEETYEKSPDEIPKPDKPTMATV